MSNSVAWYNQVLAIPYIGVSFRQWLGFRGGIWSVLDRLQSRWNEQNGSIDLLSSGDDGTVKCRLNNQLNEQLNLDLNASKIVCSYQYQVSIALNPGRLPTYSTNAVRPVGDTFTEIAQALVPVLREFSAASKSPIERVGVLLDARIVADEAPPGVMRFLEYFQRPWPGKTLATVANVNVLLNENDHSLSQCQHMINQPNPGSTNEFQLRLDWGIKMLTPTWREHMNIEGLVNDSLTGALNYFNEFGMTGGME